MDTSFSYTSSSSASSQRHLQALLWKNLILMRRNWRATIMEILLPLVFICAMVGISNQFPLTYVPPQTVPGGKITLPSLYILSARLQLSKQKLCIVPGTPSMKPYVDDLMIWLTNNYPGFNGSTLNLDFSSITANPNLGKWQALQIPSLDTVLCRFPNEEALRNHIKASNYGDDGTKIYAAIVLHEGAPHWSYSLRFNYSEVADTSPPQVDTLSRAATPEYASRYAYVIPSFGDNLSEQKPDNPILALPLPGFSSLQLTIDRWIMNTTIDLSLYPPDTTNLFEVFFTGIAAYQPSNVAPLQTSLQALITATSANTNQAQAVQDFQSLYYTVLNALRAERFIPQQVDWIGFPTRGYYVSDFYNVASTVLALFLVLAYLYPVSRLIRGLVMEKETKLREGMRMMGLRNSALTGSWLITYGLVFTFIAAIATGIIKGTFYPKTDGGYLFLVFLFFGWSATTWSFCVSIFFSRAKTAATVGVVSFLALAFPYYGVAGSTVSSSGKLGSSVCAPTAFGLTIDLLSTIESNGQGINFTNINYLINGYTAANGLLWLIGDTILYGLLGLYLDAVLPVPFREYGIPRPWNFLFTQKFWHEITMEYFPSSSRTKLSSSSLPPLPDAKPHPLVEPLDIELSAKLNEGRGISVRRLKKQFLTPDGTKTAVDGIDLDMFEGQIFVLLGHNGAGKTTTISMLTGLIEPTDGDASVFGKRLGANLSLIQQDLGICPQHDVLWPELTVKEHLELFAAIKKIPVIHVSAAVERAIGEVGLGEKTNALAGSLSGGQKRKLSVAIALLGGSKVVFLDEPTSGMDPYSRRSTWQTLQNAREGRVIVLTTHFMDEADILGDRIAIMAEGQVRCIGSPMYLKQKFGVGYTLTCVRNIVHRNNGNGNTLVNDTSTSGSIVSSSVILDIVKRYIPTAKLQSDVGAELSLGLPLNNQSLSSLFRELENRSQELGISSLAMSVTTIEDVFLHVCGRHEGKLNSLDTNNGTNEEIVTAVLPSEPTKKPKKTEEEDSSLPDVRQVDMMFSSLYHMSSSIDTSSSSSFFLRYLYQFGIHIRALLYKRFSMMLRDKKAIFYSFLLPVCVIIGGVGLIQLAIPNEAISYQLSTAQYNTDPMGNRDIPIYPNRVPSLTYKMNAWNAETIPSSIPDIEQIYNCLRTANVSKDSPRLSVSTVRNTNDPYSFISAKSNPVKSTLNDDIQSFSAWLLEDSLNYPDSVYGAYGFTWNGTLYGTNQQNGTHLWNYSPFTNISNGVITYAIFHNTTSRHAAPIYMNLLHSALYARLRNDPCMVTSPSAVAPSPAYSITTHSYPLPFSLTQTTLLASYLSGSAATITMIALAFVPSVFAANIVSEREAGAKHQQLISGVSIPAYWISSTIFDIASALIPALLTVAVYAIFNIQDYVSTKGHRVHALVTLFVLYAGALPGSTYLLSFFFRNTSSSQNGTLMANLFAVLAMIASMIMGQALGDPSLCKADTGLRYIYRLLPGFSLGNGLYTLAFLDLQPSLNLKCAQARGDEITDINSMLQPIDAFAWKGTGTNIAFLAVEIFLYPLIAIGIDTFNSYPIIQVRLAEVGKQLHHYVCCGRYRSLSSVLSSPAGNQVHTKISPLVQSKTAVEEDKDVVFEARRVNNLLTADEQAFLAESTTKEDIVRILSLHKQYSNEKIAIHNLSFGIQPNECFGFLGVNGAGKTTTMKILTGDILPTSGTARLGGYDILTQQSEVRRLVGYCPQFDALLDLLSVKEHIELYARIKGIPESMVSKATVAAMDALGIMMAANKPSHTLSGGTKRKLSVAIAMIGGPPLLFLDEPSTGMDPISRRALWKVLAAASTGHINTQSSSPSTSSSSGCSIILTTHSMEEVEALCNRIGIMVNGRLQCLGTATHLRARFGTGFDINIKLLLPTDNEIQKLVDILKTKEILYGTVPEGNDTLYVREDDTKIVCEALDDTDRYSEINEKGSGWSIAAAFARLSLPLRKYGTTDTTVNVAKCIKVSEFVQWWIEENLVENIQHYITKEKFPGSALIERQGSVLRFRIRIDTPDTGELDNSSSPSSCTSHSLSHIFATLETIRDQFSLASFAVSHASLEDVFNMFAAGSVDPDDKHGNYDSIQTPHA